MSVPKLPLELERMIFLLVPRRTAHSCLLVAKRVQGWLERNLYRVVCLTNESRAQKFLLSMEHRPEFATSVIEALCLNASIKLEMGASILKLSAGLKFLNMCFPCHRFGAKNPVLDPLSKLSCLEALYVDLSSIFNHRDIYLPNVSVFHQVTHLHLSNAWATWSTVARSIGLHELKQITHLSLYLLTVHTLPRPPCSFDARNQL
ncbi:hypothetical protein JVT61DRAFT_11819 [Boletus reticuloceps]|uniref:F-box domain-containing protein n=1 Tax=Boletus reticuloceps TaxID=495285 RepID=A0A8I3AEG0_9AGAM|nr:hypothetical protein JVT61DRAFT_11819 [Boletus reticuloceps]